MALWTRTQFVDDTISCEVVRTVSGESYRGGESMGTIPGALFFGHSQFRQPPSSAVIDKIARYAHFAWKHEAAASPIAWLDRLVGHADWLASPTFDHCGFYYGTLEIPANGGGVNSLDNAVLTIPCWSMAAVTGIFPFAHFSRRIRRHAIRKRRQKSGHCIACGYDLRFNDSKVCPECGSAVMAKSAA